MIYWLMNMGFAGGSGEVAVVPTNRINRGNNRALCRDVCREDTDI